MLSSKAYKRCFICGEEFLEGIIICNKLLCYDCEREICRTGSHQSKYYEFVDKIKELWKVIV